MTEALLVLCLVLLAVILVLQVLLGQRKVGIDLSPLQQEFKSVEDSYERAERAVREEIAKNREEASKAARQSREELGFTLKGFNNSLVTSIGEMGKLQKSQLDVFAERLEKLTQTLDQKLGTMRETIEQRLTLLQEDNGKKLDQMRQESTATAQKAREEVSVSLKSFSESVAKTLTEMDGHQRRQLSDVLEQSTKLTDSTETKLDRQRREVDGRLKQIQDESSKKMDQMREEMTGSSKAQREEVGTSLKGFNDSVLRSMAGMAEAQQQQMESFTTQLGKLTESNEKKLDGLKATVEEKLKAIQEDNAKQIEQMRATVDEKLQGTLEKRLDESFKQVSERLEAVHKGLGEMQQLATGVGDLKKVLTNVKTRGTWGEVQLGAMLEQVLNPDQYETNVATKDSGERVEFAIKFPGRSEDKDQVVWLPIDAKFPIEDYQRLVEAQENADPEAAEAAAKALENRVKGCARDICEKYLCPPKTTDFGILFLPVEGLFAEIIRRTGLVDLIQREYRVLIAGPTTLWAILNSLQMGFRTLQIQQRSGEVWNLLSAVKTEWTKYGDVLVKVRKKLQEASNTIDQAETRTRAIGRKLRDVQELPAADAQAVLMLENGRGNEDEDEELA